MPEIRLIGLSAEVLQALRIWAAEENIPRLELIRRILLKALSEREREKVTSRNQ